MTRIEISLSRAHKIAERLKTQAADLSKEALAQAQVTHIAGITGDAHIQRLSAQGDKAMALSAKSERYLRVMADVRTVIARENEARGINALLARLDVVNRLVTQKKELLEQAKSDGIEPSELASYKPLMGSEARSYSAGVAVNVLGQTRREVLEAALSQLQREAVQVSDRIAEANAARLALELDDDIAVEVTGG